MNWTDVLIDVLLVVFVIDCALMCLVVLMQRSKQEGLGAAFGGGMMDTAFGAQTSRVLVKATIWFAAIFFILSISLARLYANRAAVMEKGSPVSQELLNSTAPASTNAAPVVPGNGTTQPVVPPATPSPATPAPASPAPATPAKPATH